MNKLLSMLLSLALVVLLLGCNTLKDAGGEKIYSIGDRGPASGIVFYDKGEYSDGWRYLEVAPVEVERPLQWGTYDTFVEATQSHKGSGLENTVEIVKALQTLNERGRAAQYCEDLIHGGHADWFLPSKEELDLLYWNLAFKELGSFAKIGSGYWSSTEYDDKRAWGQGFHAGVQGRIEKFDIFLVRPIRTF